MRVLKYEGNKIFTKIVANATAIERKFTWRDRYTQMGEQIRNPNTTVKRVHEIPVITTYKNTRTYYQ